MGRGLPARIRQALGPAIGVQALLLVLFVAHLVPPVPLSVRSLGVWHRVEREGAEFKLSRLPRPRWRDPWRGDERVFVARPGDKVFVFTRVFAPHNFRDQVRVRWATWEPARRKWTQSDAIPLRIVGGREEGFGGYAYKQNWTPGEWEVSVETEDGREIGRVRFGSRPTPAPTSESSTCSETELPRTGRAHSDSARAWEGRLGCRSSSILT